MVTCKIIKIRDADDNQSTVTVEITMPKGNEAWKAAVEAYRDCKLCNL